MSVYLYTHTHTHTHTHTRFYKELTHAVMEAENSQDLKLTSGGPREPVL